jgi:hypothetical protein
MLLECRVAMVNTKHAVRIAVREQNGGLTQALAIEQLVSAPVLCSRKVLIGRKNVLRIFSNGVIGSLEWHTAHRAVTGPQPNC